MIGFAESLAAPEVAFSLYDQGFSIQAFTRDIDKCALRHLSFVALHEIPSPEKNLEQALLAIGDLVASTDCQALMPMDDDALWLLSRLREQGRLPGATSFIFAAPDAARIALNKDIQVDAAVACGLKTPPTMVIRSLDDLEGWDRFPCIAKPARAVAVMKDGRDCARLGKGKAAGFEKPLELRAWLEQNMTDGPFLLQPLIAGTGEGVFGLYRDGRVIGWNGHRRLRMMNPHGSGASACESRMPEPDLCDAIERFLATIKWSGLFMIELLRDCHGDSWFIELNGRAWGSMALSRRAGFDYPAWAVRCGIDPSFIPEEPIEKKTITMRHLGRDMLHLVYLLRGPSTDFYRQNWPHPLRSLIDVFTPQHPRNYYNYHPQFRMFFLRESLATVMNAIRNRIET